MSKTRHKKKLEQKAEKVEGREAAAKEISPEISTAYCKNCKYYQRTKCLHKTQGLFFPFVARKNTCENWREKKK